MTMFRVHLASGRKIEVERNNPDDARKEVRRLYPRSVILKIKQVKACKPFIKRV